MNLETLAAELEREAVVGRIVTPTHDVYRKARRLAQGDPRVTFGLGHLLPTTLDEVMGSLMRLTGSEFGPEGARDAKSWIDPRLVARQAEDAALRLREACERKQRVLFGTGHPAGPIDLYMRLAAAMALRGAEPMVFAEAEQFSLDGGRVQIRYVGSVACVSGGGELLHTHSPRPMEYLLDAGPLPDLVVGDHGFVGVALTRGAHAVGLVDTNDPALVLAWTRGLPVSPILCDDNRPPSAYHPLAEYLISRL